MDKIQIVEPNEKILAMTEKIIELNKMVREQNQSLIQFLNHPQLIVKDLKDFNNV